MLLLWGWRGLLSVLGTGTFHCPKCGVDTTYQHMRARKWFTLFFIPIIPLDWQEPYIECTRCKSAYTEAVLTIPTVAQLQHMLGLATRGLFAQLIDLDGEPTPSALMVATRMVRETVGEAYDEDNMRADVDHFRGVDLTGQLRPLGESMTLPGRENLICNLLACGLLAAMPATEARRLVDAAAAELDLTPVYVNGIADSAVARAQQITSDATWGRDA